MSREPCDMLFKPCEPGMQDCVGFGHCRCQKELDRQTNLRQQLATLTQERDALRDVVKELLGAGESISFYYSLHGKGCNCVPCMRIIRWKEVVNKVLLLTTSGEAGKGGGA